jgi:protein-S-isoprenylcysteine O-methyltransferase Ste14
VKVGRKLVAWTWGLVCHVGFVFAVGTMAWSLAHGLDFGLGRLDGAWRWVANLALLVQFPLAHSFLLGRRGARALAACAPAGLGRVLAPTTFAALAALQLAATFWLWSPALVEPWRATSGAAVLLWAAHVSAWLFLVRALHDAGLGLQTGWIGWRAALAGTAPAYPPMPQRGLFARCRQPIYLGFFLVLATGPVWSLDRMAMIAVWGGYSLLAPRLKERRHLRMYGREFEEYRRRVPYMVPRMPA